MANVERAFAPAISEVEAAGRKIGRFFEGQATPDMKSHDQLNEPMSVAAIPINITLLDDVPLR